jgi:hypothetical protein
VSGGRPARLVRFLDPEFDNWTARSAHSPRKHVRAITTWIDRARFGCRAPRRRVARGLLSHAPMSKRPTILIGEIGFLLRAAERAVRLAAR